LQEARLSRAIRHEHDGLRRLRVGDGQQSGGQQEQAGHRESQESVDDDARGRRLSRLLAVVEAKACGRFAPTWAGKFSLPLLITHIGIATAASPTHPAVAITHI